MEDKKEIIKNRTTNQKSIENDGKNVQQNYQVQVRHRKFCKIHYDKTRG